MSYSTQKISSDLLSEIKTALHKVNFGSIEIIVQDSTVTQITVRNIKKTSIKLNGDAPMQSEIKQHVTKPIYTETTTRNKIQVLTLKKE